MEAASVGEAFCKQEGVCLPAAPAPAAAAPVPRNMPARWSLFDELRKPAPARADDAEREERLALMEMEIRAADEDAVMNIACPLPVPWPVRASSAPLVPLGRGPSRNRDSPLARCVLTWPGNAPRLHSRCPASLRLRSGSQGLPSDTPPLLRCEGCSRVVFAVCFTHHAALCATVSELKQRRVFGSEALCLHFIPADFRPQELPRAPCEARSRTSTFTRMRHLRPQPQGGLEGVNVGQGCCDQEQLILGAPWSAAAPAHCRRCRTPRPPAAGGSCVRDSRPRALHRAHA